MEVRVSYKHAYGVPLTFYSVKGHFGVLIMRMSINKLAPSKTRYFTSATNALLVTLIWMSGHVVKHH